jgi:colanic acid/amylovoran biosynthesis glycosyltransferase
MNPILEQEVAAGYRAAFPKLNGVHGVCADVLREAEYYGLNISKSKVIHSGLHLDKFEFIPREKKDKTSKLYFISVGRQSWMKGYHYALDALAEIKRAGFDFEYLIIGGGSSEELLFQITDLGLQDYIKLLDWTPFEEVKKAIQISDVLLLPSVSEGIANTAIEAMALGTVVIASDCGGMKELIQNKVNGFLVPSRNPRMIADTILKWVKMPDDLKYRISQNARQTVEDKFNAKGMASSFIELYQTMEVN